jgi:1-acyl-sn-glycerol-3-phosphate acyltransferase
VKITSFVVNGTLKNITRLLCRIDSGQLVNVPSTGPLILVSNHINFLEVPLIYTHLLPRPVTGYAKSETWDNPIMARLFNLWEAIPLHRGEADLAAIRSGLNALESGKILVVTPEGTRSGHGRMSIGRPGVALLALQSQAPLLPLVYYGGEKFRQSISRIHRTDFHISVGNPFYVDDRNLQVNRVLRQKITDEIMYQLAALLPPYYRGYYADLSKATDDFLNFPAGSTNNLSRVERNSRARGGDVSNTLTPNISLS